MVEQYREREDKYDVDPEWTLPDLTDAIPPGARIEQAALSLSSRYFDTAGRDLLAHGVTLRLRSGDADNGWQLKVPDGAARTELRMPVDGTARAVPPQLRDVVFGVSGGAGLRPVATLDTTRTTTRVIDAADELLAEIDDDDVSATRPGADKQATRWREVEVELGAADEALLTAIGSRLRDSGAAPSANRTKLARVLGDTPAVHRPRKARTLGDLVTDYVDAQYAALIAGDLALRRGQDAIHATRVATRRYRSVLRVFADLFDPDQAAALDAELAWYAALLGAVRDRDVLGKHLKQTLATLPPEIDAGPLTAQIEHHLAHQQGAARQRLLRQMRGKRYLALLATLHAWHRQPPLADAASARAGTVRSYLDRADKRLAKRLKQSRHGDASDELLHRARKAGKRTRYTAELAKPALGKPARRAVKHATALQDVLGEHQDTILASDLLLQFATAADGQAAFACGVLYAHEQERRNTARKQAGKLRWT